MKHQLQFVWAGLLALLLSACSGIVGPTAQEMTLDARNVELSTQISDLRQTATVEVDRMMVTVEHASTEMRQVAFQRDALQATLIARGTDSGFIDVTIPQAGGDLPPGIDTADLLPPQNSGGAAPAVTPPGAGGAAAIDPAQITEGNNPAATPLPAASGPRLENPMLSTGVLDNDCAQNDLASFDTTTSEIYAVANAVDFPAGTTITARWTREGTEIESYTIPFNFAISDACVWAFIDQTDFAFTPGSWSVELLVNGSPGVGPIPFTITGQAPASVPDDMEESG